MKKVSDHTFDPHCPVCKGEGWVCENHPRTAWNYGDPECCRKGAGAPCRCNSLHRDNWSDEEKKRLDGMLADVQNQVKRRIQ